METTTLATTGPHLSRPCRLAEAAILEMHAGILTDESRTSGDTPERIYFPETTEEVSYALAEISRNGQRVTVSGARTGIAGGAVAATQNLLSLENVKGPVTIRTDDAEAHVFSGTTLAELNDALKSHPSGMFYPVDPTETSASIGGTIATNASGARTLKYGPTRDWVVGITAVLADGSVFKLRRNESQLVDNTLRIERAGSDPAAIPITPITLPKTKHTAGYLLAPQMDPIDLFIGGEGTLCVITEADLKLTPPPTARLCLVLFLPADEPADIVRSLLPLSPAAIEYMDSKSLDLLREAKRLHEDSGAVPDIPDEARAALYVELEGETDEKIEDAFATLEQITDQFGISEHLTWAGFENADLTAMKAFRHALPERINAIIGDRKREIPELTKVGTDMAVPVSELDAILREYRAALDGSGIEYCIFGHIGNAHLHVNILPRGMDEVEKAYSYYRIFAEKAVSLGGSVAGEHGIGRIKVGFMKIQFSEADLESMKRVKALLDPSGTLNPGVMLDL